MCFLLKKTRNHLPAPTPNKDMKENLKQRKQLHGRAIRAFLVFILAFALGIFAWKWIRHEPKDNGIQRLPQKLREGLTANERIFSGIFDQQQLVPTYPKSEAVKHVRVQWETGIQSALDTGHGN